MIKIIPLFIIIFTIIFFSSCSDNWLNWVHEDASGDDVENLLIEGEQRISSGDYETALKCFNSAFDKSEPGSKNYSRSIRGRVSAKLNLLSRGTEYNNFFTLIIGEGKAIITEYQKEGSNISKFKDITSLSIDFWKQIRLSTIDVLEDYRHQEDCGEYKTATDHFGHAFICAINTASEAIYRASLPVNNKYNDLLGDFSNLLALALFASDDYLLKMEEEGFQQLGLVKYVDYHTSLNCIVFDTKPYDKVNSAHPNNSLARQICQILVMFVTSTCPTSLP